MSSGDSSHGTSGGERRDITEAPSAPVEAVLDVPPPVSAPDGVDWSRLGDATRALLAEYTYSQATQRSYKSAWKQFTTWCAQHGVNSMPADPYRVADYLTELGSLEHTSVSRIETATAAIACAHSLGGYAYDRRHEAIVKTVRALRRKVGVAPRHQKQPLVSELVEQVCEPMGETLLDVRDRAILTLGFLLGCRRSNIAALDVEDLTFTREGVDVVLRRSKTDQEGAGREVSVPLQKHAHLCAARCVTRWMSKAGIEKGALFLAVDRWGNLGDRLTGQDVCRIVQRRCEAVALRGEDFGAHSMRSGFCTSAAGEGMALDSIMRQTGHECADSVLRYIRHASRYENNAASGLLGRPQKDGSDVRAPAERNDDSPQE